MKKNRILCLMASLTILGFIITGTPFIYGEDVILDRMNSLSYLTFIPKTSQLVSHCGSEPNGSIRFWSLVDGKLDEVISLDKKQYARPLAVSHDGSLIVIHLLLSDRLDCYSIKERKWLWKTKLSWFRDSPEDIAFTTDDGKIIAAGLRNIVALDSKNGTVLEREEKPLNDYPNFYYVPKRVFLSPSGRYLVVWQEFPLGTQGRGWTHLIVNKWVTIWDIEKKTTVGRWQKPDAGLWSAAFSHNDKEVVMGSRDGYVWVWSIEEQKIVREWHASAYRISSLRLSRNEQYLASYHGGAKIWKHSTQELIHEFKNIAFNPGEPYPMEFTSDGKYFALEKVGRLCLYDTQTWKEKWCVLSWPEDKPRKVP